MTTFRFLAALNLCFWLLAAGVHAQPPVMESLHDALQLRPEQEDSWRIFQHANAVDQQEAARRHNAAQQLYTLTAPKRVDLSVDLMKADLDALERRGAALKAFYATLSPQQQDIFDRETMRRPQWQH